VIFALYELLPQNPKEIDFSFNHLPFLGISVEFSQLFAFVCARLFYLSHEKYKKYIAFAFRI